MTTQYFIPQTLNDDTIKPDKYIRCIYKDWDNLIWAGGYYNLKVMIWIQRKCIVIKWISLSPYHQ